MSTTLKLGLIMANPRYQVRKVDRTAVRRLVEYVEGNGSTPLPIPLVLDRATHDLIDGWTRYTAYCRLFDPETEVPVQYRDYASDSAKWIDAVALNTHHGRQLTEWDKRRAIIRGVDDFGLSHSAMAQALHVTIEREGSWDSQVARLAPQRSAKTRDGRRVALKGCVMHLQGQTVSRKQAEAIDHLGGTSARYMANQLSVMAENKLLDLEDRATAEAVKRLKKALGGC